MHDMETLTAEEVREGRPDLVAILAERERCRAVNDLAVAYGLPTEASRLIDAGLCEVAAREQLASLAPVTWEREYKQSQSLQAEFSSLEEFKSYRLAMAEGRARVYAGGGVVNDPRL
jgi:hypothetical protein